MHRFFVPPELLANLAPARGATTSLSQESLGNVVAPLAGARSNLISLPKDLAHQIRDVLRLNPGEQLLLLDNSGEEIVATIAQTSMTCEEDHTLTLHDVLTTSNHPIGNVGAPLAGARQIPPISSRPPQNPSTPPQPPQNPSTSTPQSLTTVVLFIGPEGGL